MWKTMKLGDICDISIGKTPSRSDKRYWDSEKQTNNVWLSIADLTSLTDRYVSDSKEYITDEGASLFNSVPKNTLLMSFKLSIGKLAFTQCELRTNEAIAALPIKDENLILKEFLYHYLSSLNWDSIAGKDEKVKGKTLNKKKLNELNIVLPPLAEQQRIVAKLDAAFTEIDRVVEITNAKLESSERLFLKELDCSVNDEVEGESKLLGEVCELSQGLAINKGTKHLLVGKSSKPLIRIKDLVNGTEEQYITDDYENLKTEITEADLVFTRTGSLGLVFRGRRGVLHNNSFKVTPTEQLTSDYLYWWLKNPTFLSEIHRIAGKAAQPDISHKLFKAQVIKIPSHSKQLKVVTKIESIYEETQKLKQTQTRKLFHLANLKSAILAQELQPLQSEAI